MKPIGHLFLISGLATYCAAQTPVPTPTCAACSPTPVPTCSPYYPTPAPGATPQTYPAGPTSATPYPSATDDPPGYTTIPSQYQPRTHIDPNGPPPLGWRIYQPTDGHTQWPVMLIIHGGGFHSEDYGPYKDGLIVSVATHYQN